VEGGEAGGGEAIGTPNKAVADSTAEGTEEAEDEEGVGEDEGIGMLSGLARISVCC
jgi:hypothetical protein